MKFMSIPAECLFAAALICVPHLFAADGTEEVVPVKLPEPDANGWISLFNGKDLTGWSKLDVSKEYIEDTWQVKMAKHCWSVEDGCIVAYVKGSVGRMWSTLTYEHSFPNFVLEFKFKATDTTAEGSSSILYRSRLTDRTCWVAFGPSSSIVKNVSDAKSKDKPEAQKASHWNDYRITANGPHVKIELNNKAIQEESKPHEIKPGTKRIISDIIALRIESDFTEPAGVFEVRFKDIRIKILPNDK